MALVPGSPVLVPDDPDDDDISILEVTDKQCCEIFSLAMTETF